MPRVYPRLCAIALTTITVACSPSTDKRTADRSAGSDNGAFSGAVVTTVAHKPGADSSIEATVTAVTNDVIALRAASPAAAAGKIPQHEQVVNGMLTTFESRIRAMHVQTDPSWTSVIDSVRTDLARLPAMPSASLASFLPRHLNRVMRIVACIQMVRS